MLYDTPTMVDASVCGAIQWRRHPSASTPQESRDVGGHDNKARGGFSLGTLLPQATKIVASVVHHCKMLVLASSGRSCLTSWSMALLKTSNKS